MKIVYCWCLIFIWVGDLNYITDRVSSYAPVIHLKIVISGRHAHIKADKTDISW